MTTTFRLRRLIGTTPDVITDDDIVFRASRPIFGLTLHTDMMGFVTLIAPDTYGRDSFIQRNLELDAEVVEWFSQADAVAMVRYDLRANGYGDDEINGLATSDLLESFPYTFGVGTIEVD